VPVRSPICMPFSFLLPCSGFGFFARQKRHSNIYFDRPTTCRYAIVGHRQKDTTPTVLERPLEQRRPAEEVDETALSGICSRNLLSLHTHGEFLKVNPLPLLYRSRGIPHLSRGRASIGTVAGAGVSPKSSCHSRVMRKPITTDKARRRREIR
jgi:hypothetical protein